MLLLSFFIKVVFGLVFIISLYFKAVDITDIKQEITELKLVPTILIKPSIYCLLAAELFVSFSFLFDLLYFWREIFTIILLLFFSFTILLKRKKTSSISCSCFGKDSILNRKPLLRNSILISLCFINLIWDYNLSLIQMVTGISVVCFSIALINMINAIVTFNMMRKIHDNVQ
ncbi:MauE/DoxX family redox-associated membrane protein [Paenibacillus woosongensis]|uniref:MauE/DoxX family redox-associated membrane protein n=1 Tax=Paenibacillus woosongensis TaxID=307580 RepID=UPI003D31EAEA